MADEVYQDSILLFTLQVFSFISQDIYSQKPFISFKKVLCEMGKKYQGLELVSFHSVSKGFYGEYVVGKN